MGRRERVGACPQPLDGCLSRQGHDRAGCARAPGFAMAITSRPRKEVIEAAEPRLALAVADANRYTTENLFREVHRANVSTLLLKCFDYYNAWMRGMPPWAWGRALSQCGPRLWQRDLVLPSGWMKSFPALGMRPIGRSINAWWREH